MISLVLAATLLTIPPSVPGARQNTVDATSSPAGVRLVWSEGNDTIGTTVIEPSGTFATPARLKGQDGVDVGSPHVACSDRDCLAVWLQARSKVVGRFIGSDESVFTIASRAANTIEDVAIAWTGTDYVVAWSGAVYPGGGAARVNTSGVVTLLNVASGLRSSWSSLDVAPIANDALIAWTERDDSFNGSIATWIEVARASDPKNVVTIAKIQTGLWPGNAGLLFLRDPRLACTSERCVLTWTLQYGPGRGSETHFEEFATTLADVLRPFDENRAPAPSIGYLVTTWNVIQSVPLWAGAHFRIVAGANAMEERLVTDSIIGSPISIGPPAGEPPLSIDALPLTASSHVIAYTRNRHLNVWIVRDPSQRRRAVRR